jgi:hypothetical protein
MFSAKRCPSFKSWQPRNRDSIPWGAVTFLLARQPSHLGTLPLILYASVPFRDLRWPELEAENLSPSGSGDKNSYLIPPLTSRSRQTDQKSVVYLQIRTYKIRDTKVRSRRSAAVFQGQKFLEAK